MVNRRHPLDVEDDSNGGGNYEDDSGPLTGGGGGALGDGSYFPPPPSLPDEPPSDPGFLPLPPIEFPQDPYPIGNGPTSEDDNSAPSLPSVPPNAPVVPAPGAPNQTELPFPPDPTKQGSSTGPTQGGTPIKVGGTGATAGGSSSGGPVTVNVTVNNLEQIANDVLARIGQTISDGIQAAMAKVEKTIADTTGQITDTVSKFSNSLFGWAKDLFAAIRDQIGVVIKAIVDNIGPILKKVVDSVGTLLKDMKDTLITIIDKIGPVLDSITKHIQNINDTLIQPIATFINTTLKTIGALTTAIEKDLHDGLSGILAIPGDIAGGLSSLDASLQRTIQQLGTINEANVKTAISYAGDLLPAKFGDSIAAGLAGKPGQTIATTFAPGGVTLSTESLQQVSKQAISGLGTLLKEIASITGDSFKESYDHLHSNWLNVGGIFTPLLDGILGIITTISAIAAVVEPLLEAAQEEARTLIPVTKLDQASILAARLRGFLSDKEASTELSKLGLDTTRQAVLKDLTVFLADIQTAIEWWHRGIIDDADLDANLKQHGVIDRDFQALKDGSLRLPGVDEISRWRHFGLIDDSQASAILKTLRWDDAQIQAYIETEQSRIGATARASIQGRLDITSTSWFDRTSSIPPPDGVKVAGAREGLHPDDVQLTWLSHWNIPGFQQFILAYFRGIRTLTELHAAFKLWNIPEELWDDLIVTNRALIPFRTIPTMVAAGIIDDATARSYLRAHGFDLAAVNQLIDYATRGSKKKPAAAAQTIATLSENNARTLFDDGVLTAEQYSAILEQHGYTAALAAAQVQIEQATAHTKQRKQALTDLVAEVQIGQITVDDAVSQLRKASYTDAEIARFQLAIKRATTAAAKIPSKAELDHFLKAGVIDLDTYKSQLQLLGWAAPYLDWFMSLVTPPPDNPEPVGATP